MNVDSATHDVETDHEYDGIREFDNPMPRWWLITLYGAILFAFGYWFYYQTLGTGATSTQAYQAEMAIVNAQTAEAAKRVDPEAILAMSRDEGAVTAGATLFAQNCVACHADRGQGLIGPNLTDAWWIHGSDAKSIYKTVSEGVLTKGMPAWGPVLGIDGTQKVVAFVLSIKGKGLEGKAPEGVDDQGQPPTP